MRLITIAVILMSIIASKSTYAQLTGFSIAYGKSYKKPLHYGTEYTKLNPISISYHQYLHRFWSATIQGQYAQGNFYDQQHLANACTNTRLGGTINYWVSNDIRLLGKMARSSCKGRLVALTYKFRVFLSAGLYGNWLNSPENNISQTYLSYSFGLGVNLFQFSISKFPLEFRMGTKYVVIPFITANYLRSTSQFELGTVDDWKVEKLEFKLGLKFGFAGR